MRHGLSSSLNVKVSASQASECSRSYDTMTHDFGDAARDIQWDTGGRWAAEYRNQQAAE